MNPASPDSHRQSKEGIVCPKCLLANAPGAPFCSDCGAPIGMVATIDPIQHIHAEGFGYRSAVDGPPKLIIVVGMWLIFGPTALLFSIALWRSNSVEIAGWLVSAIGAAISCAILYRTTKNYIVKSRSSTS